MRRRSGFARFVDADPVIGTAGLSGCRVDCLDAVAGLGARQLGLLGHQITPLN